MSTQTPSLTQSFGSRARSVVASFAKYLFPEFQNLEEKDLVGDANRVAELIIAMPLHVQLRLAVLEAEREEKRKAAAKAIRELNLPHHVAYREADKVAKRIADLEADLETFKSRFAAATAEDAKARVDRPKREIGVPAAAPEAERKTA
jgi:hypothetical protein